MINLRDINIRDIKPDLKKKENANVPAMRGQCGFFDCSSHLIIYSLTPLAIMYTREEEVYQVQKREKTIFSTKF